MRDSLINSHFDMQLCSHNFESACLHVLATEVIYHIPKDERHAKRQLLNQRRQDDSSTSKHNHGVKAKKCRT
jgi:hypothetical protein